MAYFNIVKNKIIFDDNIDWEHLNYIINNNNGALYCSLNKQFNLIHKELKNKINNKKIKNIKVNNINNNNNNNNNNQLYNYVYKNLYKLSYLHKRELNLICLIVFFSSSFFL